MRRPKGWLRNGHGRLEFEGLAIDAGVRLARARPDLELLTAELEGVATTRPLPGQGESDDLGRLRARRCAHGKHTKLARVESEALGRAGRRGEHIGVVRHHDEKGPVHPGALRCHERQIKGLRGLAQHLGEQSSRRGRLRLSVALLLDDGGVDTEGDVVDEEAVVHRGVVDPALDGIAEGVHTLAGVGAIEPEVEGEVVSGPRGHADEREIVLYGDGGDQCL